MTEDTLLAQLEAGVREAVRLLVKRCREGEATAADISQLRALFRDAGGTLTFTGKPNVLGDEILKSLENVDPDLLN